MTLPAVKRRRVSKSKVLAFRRCEQQYYLRYFKRLRRKERAVAPERGIILHEYLEGYYIAIQKEIAPEKAHQDSIDSVAEKHNDRLRELAREALASGAQDSALAIIDMIDQVADIAERYYAIHGKDDASRYKILLTEQRLLSEIAPGIDSAGFVDLVTLDKQTERVSIWEHKSTGDIPPQSVRLFDLQTSLYNDQLMELFWLPIDSVVWNYIRTKVPVVPAKLQRGGLSRDKRIDTTWEVYFKAILDNELNPDDYLDMREVLDGKERNIFFPRYEQVIVVEDLMTDYVKTALDIAAAEESWESDNPDLPVRNLDRSCEWCEFKRLCFAALTGGDQEDIIRLDFEVDTYVSSSEREETDANQDETA